MEIEMQRNLYCIVKTVIILFKNLLKQYSFELTLGHGGAYQNLLDKTPVGYNPVLFYRTWVG